jgi:hypothetical protein
VGTNLLPGGCGAGDFSAVLLFLGNTCFLTIGRPVSVWHRQRVRLTYRIRLSASAGGSIDLVETEKSQLVPNLCELD